MTNEPIDPNAECEKCGKKYKEHHSLYSTCPKRGHLIGFHWDQFFTPRTVREEPRVNAAIMKQQLQDKEDEARLKKMLASEPAPVQEGKHTPDKMMMPLQDWPEVKIPFGLLNEEWTRRNHDQSLERLRERMGISVNEALCIIGKHKFVRRDIGEARSLLHKLLTGYNIGVAETAAALQEANAKLEEAYREIEKYKNLRNVIDGTVREQNQLFLTALAEVKKQAEIILTCGTQAAMHTHAEKIIKLAELESKLKHP